MKRLLTSLIALTALSGSVAMADSHRDQDRHDGRGHDNRNWNDRGADHGRDRAWDHRNDRRADDRYDNRNDRRDWNRNDWRDSRSRYHASRYYAPHGYRYRVWHRGERLPSAYYAPRYVVRDYNAYRLYAPPRGYHWVRVGNDVVLAAIAGGIVAAVVSDLFY
jgi:Ni/Co efflux regulator RcnB